MIGPNYGIQPEKLECSPNSEMVFRFQAAVQEGKVRPQECPCACAGRVNDSHYGVLHQSDRPRVRTFVFSQAEASQSSTLGFSVLSDGQREGRTEGDLEEKGDTGRGLARGRGQGRLGGARLQPHSPQRRAPGDFPAREGGAPGRSGLRLGGPRGLRGAPGSRA